jgi:hypothetical protein
MVRKKNLITQTLQLGRVQQEYLLTRLPGLRILQVFWLKRLLQTRLPS